MFRVRVYTCKIYYVANKIMKKQINLKFFFALNTFKFHFSAYLTVSSIQNTLS